jgi:hypothetical protein
MEPYEKANDKRGKPKHCCICDKIATKTATYQVQGAQEHSPSICQSPKK